MKLSRKALAMAMASCMVLSMTACGGSETAATTAAPAGDTAAATEAPAADAGTEAEAEAEAEAPAALDGEVSVFYYTYGDTYISSVRSALDAALDAAGVKYQDYDSNNSQTTQTEQVTTAIAKGTSLLIVNLVDSGSDDAAQNIIDQASAQNIPVIFFNRKRLRQVRIRWYRL